MLSRWFFCRWPFELALKLIFLQKRLCMSLIVTVSKLSWLFNMRRRKNMQRAIIETSKAFIEHSITMYLNNCALLWKFCLPEHSIIAIVRHFHAASDVCYRVTPFKYVACTSGFWRCLDEMFVVKTEHYMLQHSDQVSFVLAIFRLVDKRLEEL